MSITRTENFDTFKIDELVAMNRRARIYDNIHMTWGKVDFTFSSEDSQERREFSYWYTVSDVIINFQKFSLSEPNPEG